jgi:colanic acid biosynthesis glycosyl transferase WcaI
MKILINDFGGYAFPIQLSKELARNGYQVIHTYLANIKTPHGNMDNEKLNNLTVVPVNLENEFNKYNIIYRYRGEVEYAGNIKKIIDNYQPDLVISANTPLFAQNLLVKICNKNKIRFIYWCQDIHSVAIENILKKKLSFIGVIISHFFKYIEVKLLNKSDHIISISDDFNQIFTNWGIPINKITTINNWGPINEITLHPKCNTWSAKLGLCNKTCIIYSGTLGLKHNPDLIINSAFKLKDKADVVFIVISEGLGAELIKKESKRLDLKNMIVLDFQDYNDLPLVLSNADILISILEKDAALYSVPSKVLTYLCAKKPIVLSVPSSNLSAKILSNANAGFCIESGNEEAFIKSIEILIEDSELRDELGLNGRNYAEQNFPISIIAKKFITVFKHFQSSDRSS